MTLRLSSLALFLSVFSLHVGAQVTSERLLNPEKEPQNWLTYSGAYTGQRYSRLTQIDIESRGLHPANRGRRIAASIRPLDERASPQACNVCDCCHYISPFLRAELDLVDGRLGLCRPINTATELCH